MKLRVLCLIGAKSLRGRVQKLATSQDRIVAGEAPSPDLWTRLTRDPVDVILSTPEDLPPPAKAFIESLRKLPQRPDVFLLTPNHDLEAHAELVQWGASAAVYSRLADQALRALLDGLLREATVRREASIQPADSDAQPDLADFVSESFAMRELLDVAGRVAEADTSVLILGETGVGKEWLARAIHARSRRAQGPFLALNCAAVPDGLMESELFGHVEGAFTGAVRSRRGHFELAHHGTLFLDELGEMPLSSQVKLLRAIQERQVIPVGGETTISFDARIMAATNRDIDEAIESGLFRRDLFYRVGVITLIVPPLRERLEDIPALADNYLARFAVQLVRPVERISPDVLDAFLRYSWPGNVRELINVMERAVLFARGPELTLDTLPASIVGGDSSGGRGALGALGLDEGALERPLPEVRDELVDRLERKYLSHILDRYEGRVGEVARHAGIDPRTLYNKMQDYGLRKERYRKR